MQENAGRGGLIEFPASDVPAAQIALEELEKTMIKEGLRRIKATTISGKVYDAAKREYTTTHFSIFDHVTIVEQRGRASAITSRA